MRSRVGFFGRDLIVLQLIQRRLQRLQQGIALVGIQRGIASLGGERYTGKDLKNGMFLFILKLVSHEWTRISTN